MENQINRISVKIPTYFDDTALWFKQVEASFFISNIVNEKTKYFYLISNLPCHVVKEYADNLDPDRETPYTDLKEEILSRTKESSLTCYNKLINDKQLGDRKPSQALRDLRRSLKEIDSSADLETNVLLRHSFLQLLPGNIRQILVTMNEKQLSEQAKIADQLLESDRQLTINQVTSNTDITINELKDSLKDLTIEINALRRNQERWSKKFKKEKNICFYHSKFGNRAFKCQEPCSWKDKSPITKHSENDQGFQ